MPATMATLDAVLKEIYGPRIENQLQNEVTAKKRIERTSDGVTETVGGKYVDFPIRVRRNTGIGYRPEGAMLPQAGQQGFAEVHVPLRYGYGRVKLTGQTMQLADKNYQSFASAMDDEMNGLKDDIAKDEGRIAYGDGTGLLCSITDTATSASHTVDNVQYLDVGEAVDVLVRSSGATVLLNTEIVTIVPSTKTVTFGASFTGAVTQGLYRMGNYGAEPSGFGNIVDDTATLFGLDPALEPMWKATVMSNSGTPRALSEGLMIEAADTSRVNGGKTSVIFGSLGVRRAYFNLLTQQRRYTDTKQFAGGFTGLAFNYGTEIPFVEDVDSPPNQMLFLDEDKFRVYRNKEWHWADDDGSTLKWVRDFDAWEGFMRQYSELGVSNRRAQVKVKDIIEG